MEEVHRARDWQGGREGASAFSQGTSPSWCFDVLTNQQLIKSHCLIHLIESIIYGAESPAPLSSVQKWAGGSDDPRPLPPGLSGVQPRPEVVWNPHLKSPQ